MGTGAFERPRPLVVTVASVIQFATLGLATTGTALGAIVTPRLLDALRTAMPGEGLTARTVEDAVDATGWLAYGITGLWLLASLVFAGLAAIYRGGVNGARVATWAVAAALLLCGVCGMTSTGAGGGLGSPDTSSERVAAALTEATPGWYLTVNGVVWSASFAAYVLIIVLLTLPAANAFFRVSDRSADRVPDGGLRE